MEKKDYPPRFDDPYIDQWDICNCGNKYRLKCSCEKTKIINIDKFIEKEIERATRLVFLGRAH